MPKRTGSPARASEKCRIAHGHIELFRAIRSGLRPLRFDANDRRMGGAGRFAGEAGGALDVGMIKHCDRSKSHDRAVTCRSSMRETAVGVARLLIPSKCRRHRVPDVKTPPVAAQVSIIGPTDVPIHLVSWIEAALFNEAGRQAQGHGRVVRPFPGLEVEWASTDHVRDRFERAWLFELDCCAYRIADGETK